MTAARGRPGTGRRIGGVIGRLRLRSAGFAGVLSRRGMRALERLRAFSRRISRAGREFVWLRFPGIPDYPIRGNIVRFFPAALCRSPFPAPPAGRETSAPLRVKPAGPAPGIFRTIHTRKIISLSVPGPEAIRTAPRMAGGGVPDPHRASSGKSGASGSAPRGEIPYRHAFHAAIGSTMSPPLREKAHPRVDAAAPLSPEERKTVPIPVFRNPGVSLPFAPRISIPAAAASGGYRGIRRPVGFGGGSRADASTVSGNGPRMAAPAYSGRPVQALDPSRDARASGYPAFPVGRAPLSLNASLGSPVGESRGGRLRFPPGDTGSRVTNVIHRGFPGSPFQTGGHAHRPPAYPPEKGGREAVPSPFPVPAPAREPASGPGVRPMAFLRSREKAPEKNGGEEAVRKTVEEILERRILPRMEALVARETSPDSPPMRKLGEWIYSGLYEGLVLEKERMGLI